MNNYELKPFVKRNREGDPVSIGEFTEQEIKQLNDDYHKMNEPFIWEPIGPGELEAIVKAVYGQ